MPKLIILGSSNAIPDRDHENTHMALVGKSSTVLIDCVNNAISRLEQAGIDFNNLTDLILTHFHPDHVYGVPQLLMNMWLLGRNRLLNIYGLDHTIERVEKTMELYSWSDWPNFFAVKFHRVAEQDAAPVFEGEEFRITATPVKHFIPTIGLRIEFTVSKKTLAYSCDTEPCPQVIRLAAGADTFIHEAAGAIPGHSSAGQAGDAARRAEVGELFLIHYPTGRFAKGDLVAEARERFGGPVKLATDFMTLEF